MGLWGGWDGGVGILAMGRVMGIGIQVHNSTYWGNFWGKEGEKGKKNTIKRERKEKKTKEKGKRKNKRERERKPSSGASCGVWSISKFSGRTRTLRFSASTCFVWGC